MHTPPSAANARCPLGYSLHANKGPIGRGHQDGPFVHAVRPCHAQIGAVLGDEVACVYFPAGGTPLLMQEGAASPHNGSS